jgi:hypothetical protein
MRAPQHSLAQTARQTARARGLFVEVRGQANEQQRADEIANLPRIEWKGKVLHEIRCRGDYGRGPHLVNVSEQVLWCLIDLRHFRCPFHR